MSRFAVQLLLAYSVALSPATAWAAVSITGHGRYEKIKGKPAVGYVELYESDLFLSPPNNSYVGPSSRLGGAAYALSNVRWARNLGRRLLARGKLRKVPGVGELGQDRMRQGVEEQWK